LIHKEEKSKVEGGKVYAPEPPIRWGDVKTNGFQQSKRGGEGSAKGEKGVEEIHRENRTFVKQCCAAQDWEDQERNV